MLAIVSTSEVATCLHLRERQGIERKVPEIWEQCYKCVFFSAIIGYDQYKKKTMANCAKKQCNCDNVLLYLLWPWFWYSKKYRVLRFFLVT